jgi:hypothetical protein
VFDSRHATSQEAKREGATRAPGTLSPPDVGGAAAGLPALHGREGDLHRCHRLGVDRHELVPAASALDRPWRFSRLCRRRGPRDIWYSYETAEAVIDWSSREASSLYWRRIAGSLDPGDSLLLYRHVAASGLSRGDPSQNAPLRGWVMTLRAETIRQRNSNLTHA